jgi:plasmid stabilization system protein ParE
LTLGIELHHAASAELEAAAEWYESRRDELGEELLQEVDRALEVIAESPSTWPLWPDVRPSSGVRRFILPRFPFALPYVILGDRIVVLAVAHMRRRPRYWMTRLPK